MMDHFAPPSENNTARYKKFLHEVTGVKDNRKINAFTDNEFEKLWQGVEQIEGYKEGSIVQMYKITHARQEKSGCICDYYVDPAGWIIKKECIALAKKGQVELEVCTSRLGQASKILLKKSLGDKHAAIFLFHNRLNHIPLRVCYVTLDPCIR